MKINRKDVYLKEWLAFILYQFYDHDYPQMPYLKILAKPKEFSNVMFCMARRLKMCLLTVNSITSLTSQRRYIYCVL